MKYFTKFALAIVIIGGLIFAAYSLSSREVLSSGSSKTVTLVVDYEGNWNGTYFFSDVAVPMYGTGHMEFPKSLHQGNNDIRFSVLKGDSSSNELKISILNSDGELLRSASTTLANGEASINITVN